MLAVPKPIASLSSGLLARKGQARPAMRRQMTVTHSGDDLGWNDMGEPLPVAEAPRPTVLAQRDELENSFDAAPEMPALSTPTDKHRAAFTLRLDGDRHLRLRLASATRRVSAQKLMTQALDEFLKTMPELEPLAARASGAN